MVVVVVSGSDLEREREHIAIAALDVCFTGFVYLVIDIMSAYSYFINVC